MTNPSFPSNSDELVRLIQDAASGAIAPEMFLRLFRETHEVLERAGRVRYASKEQARLIWDVLWDMEYCSPDPSKEARPGDWHTADHLMKTVKHTAEKLAKL
ncbi:MAG: hypothetical protein HYZ49_13185 [Chloroflexi bacterium]|nr:hypothetical protein [Chloroflexota bacterium]